MNGPGPAAVEVAPGAPAHRCPVCGCTTFIPFNGRAAARCSGCLSVERNRLLWMILQKRGRIRPGIRVLHMAPELGLSRHLQEICGERYHACDLDAERYRSRFMTVRPMDLCTDLRKLPSSAYDLILHSHVLEHLPCSVEAVLREMERVLAPGGDHFLSVPIRGKQTAEDLDESLTPEERRRRFGQEDHMRIFGTEDLTAMLRRVWGAEDPLVEPITLFSPEELTLAGIPQEAWRGFSSHAIFHHRRPLHRPLQIAASPVPPAPLPPPSPRRPEPGGPGLLILTGTKRAGLARMEGWLRPAAEALRRQGVQCWPAEQRPAEILFGGFGTAERRARGESWLRSAEARPGGAPTPEAARASLDAWIERLGTGTGLFVSDTFWSLQAPEVAALADHLAARGVRTRVVCWIRPPADQMAAMLEERLRRDLALDDLTPGLARDFRLAYDRLDAWLSALGTEAVSVQLAPEEPIEGCRAVLAEQGVTLPDLPVPAAPPPEPTPSREAARALLALRAGGATVDPAVQADLLKRPGEPLAFPDFVWRLLEPTLARDIGYLAARFGLDPAALGRGPVTVDDAAFLNWDAASVRGLVEGVTAGTVVPA